jgi:hypothetical protein
VKATLLLCDSAQAVGGKLYILGGGWSIAGPGPITMGLAIKIEVPWDQANQPHKLQIELVDDDGQAVILPTPEGEKPIGIEADFEVGRPPGLTPGTPLDSVLAINMQSLPIPAGRRYEWRMSIDGHPDEAWRVSFTTRPQSAAT